MFFQHIFKITWFVCCAMMKQLIRLPFIPHYEIYTSCGSVNEIAGTKQLLCPNESKLQLISLNYACGTFRETKWLRVKIPLYFKEETDNYLAYFCDKELNLTFRKV